MISGARAGWLLAAVVACAGCHTDGVALREWTLQRADAAAAESIRVPVQLELPKREHSYRLVTTHTLPEGWRKRELTLSAFGYRGDIDLYVDGVLAPCIAQGPTLQRLIAWRVRDADGDGRLRLELTVHHHNVYTGWWEQPPVLRIGRAPPPGLVTRQHLNSFSVIACIGTLAMIVFSYAVLWVFEREHLCRRSPTAWRIPKSAVGRYGGQDPANSRLRQCRRGRLRYDKLP